ncbi:hypothetical protein DM02DRAFT_55386 [Periconia macrospinosa]|uniref:Uncharacterized protein n=1 Tax=Periconia macrospinosa TaxID=97972 RepID=A0A2V1E5X5_9PLEO|nr:hypothetical protein DM02DRAFT_55386 [Periconia macrospinosa]
MCATILGCCLHPAYTGCSFPQQSLHVISAVHGTCMGATFHLYHKGNWHDMYGISWNPRSSSNWLESTVCIHLTTTVSYYMDFHLARTIKTSISMKNSDRHALSSHTSYLSSHDSPMLISSLFLSLTGISPRFCRTSSIKGSTYTSITLSLGQLEDCLVSVPFTYLSRPAGINTSTPKALAV